MIGPLRVHTSACNFFRKILGKPFLEVVPVALGERLHSVVPQRPGGDRVAFWPGSLGTGCAGQFFAAAGNFLRLWALAPRNNSGREVPIALLNIFGAAE